MQEGFDIVIQQMLNLSSLSSLGKASNRSQKDLLKIYKPLYNKPDVIFENHTIREMQKEVADSV